MKTYIITYNSCFFGVCCLRIEAYNLYDAVEEFMVISGRNEYDIISITIGDKYEAKENHEYDAEGCG